MANNSSEPMFMRIPHYVRFWYFLSANTISLVGTILTLYFLLSDRTLRQALHNHVLIVLLFLGFIYEVTVIPWFLQNDRFSQPWSASPSFYHVWVYLDYSLYSLQIALFAWTTMERHILIFHSSWVVSSKQRLLIHYFPIIGIVLYYVVYYSIVYFAIPCQSPFDGFLSGGIYIPCAFDRTVLATWDLMFHQVLPTLIITIFCLGLVVRVAWRKMRIGRQMDWRRHRQMIVQLLIIAIIYIFFNLPWIIVIFAYQCGLPPDVAIVGIIFSKFLYYNIIYFFPIVCCLSLSELRKKFLRLILCQQLKQPLSSSDARSNRPTQQNTSTIQ